MNVSGTVGRGLVFVLATSILTSFGAPCLAQGAPRPPGRIAVHLPDPSDEGTWDGTWSFQSVAMRMALWIRTRQRTIEIKLKYDGLHQPSLFETDWNGDASYYSSEHPATFRMHKTKADANRIEGTWFWESQFGNSPRVENGKFTLYRALDGRTLVFRFDDFELTTTRRGKPYRSEIPPVWTFQKVSKRQALWDEIPF